jgi:hypothetical protein
MRNSFVYSHVGTGSLVAPWAFIMRFQTVASLLFVLLAAACGGETDEDKQPSPLSASSSSGQPASTSSGAPMTQTGPVVWSANASGCGDIYVYVSDATETKYLKIRASRAGLGLTKVGDKVSFDLAEAPSDTLGASVDVYPREGGGAHYCNDYVQANTPSKSDNWAATSGSIEIELLTIEENTNFHVTITLKGVVIKKTDGTTLPIPDAKYENIHVGWLAG